MLQCGRVQATHRCLCSRIAQFGSGAVDGTAVSLADSGDFGGDLAGSKARDNPTTSTTAYKPRWKGGRMPSDFRFAFPDFQPRTNFSIRHPIKERLERMDMLRRREMIDIPEFYVGSILAVTVTDSYAPKQMHRFVGICVLRNFSGLSHYFILRNVIDGLGIEIKYEMYSPLIHRIEVLKLEKRLDPDILFLRDALPEYSTIPFDMQAVPHVAGAPVPVNPIKVVLRHKPWHQRWEIMDYQGISEYEHLLRPVDIARRKKVRQEPWRRFDIMNDYRTTATLDDQLEIYDELSKFDEGFKQRQKSVSELKRRKSLVSKTSKSEHDS